MQSHRVLLSLRPDKLQIAQQVDAGVELKLDREDADLVTGDRDLAAFLNEYDMPQEQLVSVHPPPGTRGRQTDTTVTRDNVGNVIRFNDTQLQAVTPEFVVLHTDRRIDVRDHLFTLQEMAASLDVPLAVENPPGKSYWKTPEDHAFFAYTATTADTPWYLTVDTYHLDDSLPSGFVDEGALEGVVERATDDGLSEDAMERFREYVTARAAEAPISDIDAVRDDPWLPTLRTLVLAGDQVQSLHFNDPDDDGVPDLTHVDSPVLDMVFDWVARHDINLVLEPDEYDVQMLRDAVDTLQQRLV